VRRAVPAKAETYLFAARPSHRPLGSAPLWPRLTPPRPSGALTDTPGFCRLLPGQALLRFARRAGEVSHGKTLHFSGAAARSTRACARRSIGRPRPRPDCPTALAPCFRLLSQGQALDPVPVRRLPVLPPASSLPRITATQLPLASGSAPCGPQRTSTSKFSIMRGIRGSRLSPG
jgi:hypothetical protein